MGLGNAIDGWHAPGVPRSLTGTALQPILTWPVNLPQPTVLVGPYEICLRTRLLRVRSGTKSTAAGRSPSWWRSLC